MRVGITNNIQAAKRNLGQVNIKTMQVSGHPLDCFGGDLEFDKEFPMVASCFLLAGIYHGYIAC